MPYSLGCEPLRVWCRLEPRPRSTDFSRALRAEIYDPAWMLARQWQFGEFAGEDSGSVVLARVASRAAPLDRFGPSGKPLGAYTDTMPLESRVEQEAIPDDWNRRVQTGRQWLRILDSYGQAYNRQGSLPLYDAAQSRQRFFLQFPIVAPSGAGADPAAVVAQARLHSNPALRQFLAAVVGRAGDGLGLARALPAGPLQWSTLPVTVTTGIPDPHRRLFLQALESFRTWIRTVWSEPETAASAAWNKAQLEYQFNCRVPRPGGGLVLQSTEYHAGHLDWSAFDLGPESTSGGGVPGAGLTEKVFSVIPTRAEYPGQPNPRWWQLEDGAVDLGNIRADTTDIARIIVAEFALVYGNNWLVIPCRQKVGTLAEVLGIVVIDVFGQRTLVQSTTRNAAPSWTRWDFFSLGLRPQTTPRATLGAHLLLPPTVPPTQDGPTRETVHLVRDEMTNTVWGIERRISDGLGRSRDGSDAARAFRAALPAPASPTEPPGAEVVLRYTLGSSIPENWIPFLPVHNPGDDRSVRLQRASMPRVLLETIHPVRPLTRILRPGLGDDDRQASPYFIHEEEVPRAGVTIEGRMRRTRWYDGATFVWYGRRKHSGRGEGSSGLRFDVLEDLPKKTSD